MEMVYRRIDCEDRKKYTKTSKLNPWKSENVQPSKLTKSSKYISQISSRRDVDSKNRQIGDKNEH